MAKKSHLLISVMGTLGTGKSTAAKLLAQALETHLLLEQFEDNPFLPRFYGDMKRWGLTYQIFFLMSMVKRTEKAKYLLHKTTVVEDSSLIQYVYSYAQAQRIYENMDEEEWQLYLRLYREVQGNLPVPNLIVYLDATVETIVKRVASRGREYETAIPEDYLHLLNRLNDEWLANNHIIPVCRIDTNNLNLVESKKDQKTFLDLVTQSLPIPALQSPLFAIF